MAETVTAPAAGKKERKAASNKAAKIGHNLPELKVLLTPFRDEFNRKKDEQETVNGEYTQDFRNLIEKISNETGIPKVAVRFGLNQQRAEIKLGQRLADLSQSERESTLLCAEALGIQTPIGAFLKRQAEKDAGKDS